jgi:presenilin-like A22 family membrane protease
LKESDFRATPQHLLPVVGSLLLTGILTYFVVASNVQVESITIFPETSEGATLNTLLFIVPIAAMATIMYLLVKYGRERLVKKLIKTILIFAIFLLTSWYGEILLSAYSVYGEFYRAVELSLSATVTFALSYATYRLRGSRQLGAIITIGSLTGTFLGLSIPALTAIILLVVLSAYDLIAVYKGPIGKIAEKVDLEGFVGAVCTYKNLTVGMGDIVFYSMLASNAMINLGQLSFLGASIGLVVGAYAGFKMLEQREIFPGLPFALLLGLGLAILISFVHQGFG